MKNKIINVFYIITYQDWTRLYDIFIDSNSQVTVQGFYFAIVTFGGFFIMRLILAAQNEAFLKIRLDEKKEKLNAIKQITNLNPDVINKMSDIESFIRNIDKFDPKLFLNDKEASNNHKKSRVNKIKPKSSSSVHNLNLNQNYDEEKMEAKDIYSSESSSSHSSSRKNSFEKEHL